MARHPNLSVANALPLCEGTISRSRVKDGKVEKSILDFFVVCSRVLPHITKMVIDENKKHVLTNYRGVKKGIKATDTDHFTEYLDIDLQLITKKKSTILRIKNLNVFLRIFLQTLKNFQIVSRIIFH